MISVLSFMNFKDIWSYTRTLNFIRLTKDRGKKQIMISIIFPKNYHIFIVQRYILNATYLRRIHGHHKFRLCGWVTRARAGPASWTTSSRTSRPHRCTWRRSTASSLRTCRTHSLSVTTWECSPIYRLKNLFWHYIYISLCAIYSSSLNIK